MKISSQRDQENLARVGFGFLDLQILMELL